MTLALLPFVALVLLWHPEGHAASGERVVSTRRPVAGVAAVPRPPLRRPALRVARPAPRREQPSPGAGASSATSDPPPSTLRDGPSEFSGLTDITFEQDVDGADAWYGWEDHRAPYWPRTRRGYGRRRSLGRFGVLLPALSSGDAPTGDANFDPCAIFPRACPGGGSARARASAAAPSTPAQLRREGGLWVLVNDRARVRIDPQRACAVDLADATSQEPFAASALTFVTPSDAEPCAVSELRVPNGAAVTIAWHGRAWSQRAVVSLDDDAATPEASLALVRELSSQHRVHYLANLSGTTLAWNLGGHEVEVAPGHRVRVAD